MPPFSQILPFIHPKSQIRTHQKLYHVISNKQIPERKVLLFVIVVLIYCSSNCCYLFLLVSNCWTLQCLTAEHWDLNFHHGKHGNALGLLRLSLRESSSLRSSVNLTTSSQANLRDTEMVTKIRFSLPDHNLSINSLLFYLWGCTPDPVLKVYIK